MTDQEKDALFQATMSSARAKAARDQAELDAAMRAKPRAKAPRRNRPRRDGSVGNGQGQIVHTRNGRSWIEY